MAQGNSLNWSGGIKTPHKDDGRGHLYFLFDIGIGVFWITP